MVYLIWCVAYTDIEVLEILHSQHILSRTGISRSFPLRIGTKSLV